VGGWDGSLQWPAVDRRMRRDVHVRWQFLIYCGLLHEERRATQEPTRKHTAHTHTHTLHGTAATAAAHLHTHTHTPLDDERTLHIYT
jgi:hypothetical protein